jgi:hypothetical protein
MEVQIQDWRDDETATARVKWATADAQWIVVHVFVKIRRDEISKDKPVPEPYRGSPYLMRKCLHSNLLP